MTPPRIVIDSNVAISVFLFGGKPARVLESAISGVAQCFTSLPILDEIRGVLQRPKFGLTAEQALAVVEEFHHLCQVVEPLRTVHAITDDPKDNMVLECAHAAQAEFIVSGDAHLLDLARWEGILIVSPAEFTKELGHPPERGAPRPR